MDGSGNGTRSPSSDIPPAAYATRGRRARQGHAGGEPRPWRGARAYSRRAIATREIKLKITDSFEVHRDVESVWALFEDVDELAQCLPGAELTENHGQGHYSGRVKANLGPMTATFEGEATVESNRGTYSGTVVGKGVDRRGGSRAQLRIAYSIEAISCGTRVLMEADVMLSGSAAQFGRVGLLEEMTGRIIGDFVDCVEAKLAAPTVAAAAAVQAPKIKGLSLLLTSLFAPITRLFRRLLRKT